MATTNTISGQLTRISSAAINIWNKAKDMSLALPAGTYWDLSSKSDKDIVGTGNYITSDDSEAASYIIDDTGSKATYNFGIDAVAAAIEAINSRPYLEKSSASASTYLAGDLELSAGGSIYIPVGYNKTAFTVSAESIGSLLIETDIASKYLYAGKTAYAVDSSGTVTRVTGSLSNVYLYLSLGAYSTSKINSTTKTLLVSINSGWATDNTLSPTDLLDTNIAYRGTQSTEPEEGSSTSNGTIGITTNLIIDSYDVYSGTNSTGKTAKQYLKLTPSVGYYDNSWSTNILYNPTINNSITVKRYIVGDTTTDVASSIVVPAGYYPSDVTIKAVVEDSEGNIENALNYTDITISGDTKGDYTFTDGTVTFKPSTFISGSVYDYFGNVTLNKAEYSTNTNGLITISKGGWINSGTYGSAYGGLSALTSDNILSTNYSNEKIISKTFDITVEKGHYNLNNVVRSFTIKSGEHSNTTEFNWDNAKFGGSEEQAIGLTITKLFGKITDTIKEGWLDPESTTNYIKIVDWTRKSDTEGTEDYYTVGASGWILAGKYVGTSLYTPASTIYDPNNATTDLTISAGAILTGGLTVKKISSGKATYSITLYDLANSDDNTSPTLITIKASDDTDKDIDTYMTEVTVDMSLILEELLKI